jgi:hypothetical protein
MGKAIARFNGGGASGAGGSPGLNILSFGAVGDGTTDNSNALQNAINAAIDNGCALYVPIGNFAFGTTLQIKGPLTLYGLTESFLQGGWLGTGGVSGSRLTYTGSGTAVNITGPTSTTPLNYRVILRYLSIGTGLSIASPAAPPSGTIAIAVNCEESEFEHLEISGFDTGIMVTHLAISSIHDCQWECNNDHINAPPNQTFAFVAIYRNNFFAASRSAIRLNSGVSIWMRFNYFEACQYSLWVENSTGFPQIYTCLFSDNDANTKHQPRRLVGHGHRQRAGDHDREHHDRQRRAGRDAHDPQQHAAHRYGRHLRNRRLGARQPQRERHARRAAQFAMGRHAGRDLLGLPDLLHRRARQ